MPKVLDNIPHSKTAETTRSGVGGRVRCPSEKVQAMFEDHEQEKMASQKKAEATAKWRKDLTQKRVQSTKAAEQVTRRLEAQLEHEDHFTRAGNPTIVVDSVFTSRPVGGHKTANSHMVLASPLVAQSGTVPPVPSGMPLENHPPRIRALTHTEMLIIPQGIITTWKRVCKREAIPLPKQEIERRIVHLNGQKMCYNEDDAISNKTTTTKGYDLDELVSKKHARRTLRCDSNSEDNDVTDKALSDMEHQQVEEVKIHGPVKDEPMDVNMPAPKLPALSPQPATTGSESKGRPKAGDYDLATCQVLETAIEICCAILLTETPFPTATQEVKWAKAAWEIAHQHHDSNLAHDITVLKLIMAWSTHLRGQFKSKARMIIATIFGFETSIVKAVQQQNRNLVVELKKNSSFIYRTHGLTLDQHNGIYQNKGIQQLINEVLFKNKSDNGIKWAKYYKPFPASAFALALTVLQCAIDEWATGSREPIPFKEYEYTSIFTAHFQSLNNFVDASAKYDLVPKLMQQVYNNGCVHANIETDAAPPKISTVPQQAFMNAIRDYERTEKV